MRSRARTPQELAALFEEAFVIRDSAALARLYEDRAVLVAGGGGHGEDRSTEKIAHAATALVGTRLHVSRRSAKDPPGPRLPPSTRSPCCTSTRTTPKGDR